MLLISYFYKEHVIKRIWFYKKILKAEYNKPDLGLTASLVHVNERPLLLLIYKNIEEFEDERDIVV